MTSASWSSTKFMRSPEPTAVRISMSVLERSGSSRNDVQRVGLSATVGNPDAILGWLRRHVSAARVRRRPAEEPVGRQLRVVYRPDLALLSRGGCEVAKGQKSLFFCQSRSTAEAVAGLHASAPGRRSSCTTAQYLVKSV